MAARKSKKQVRRFQRVAEQRLEEAAFLLEHEYTNASVYLAGYAVECMLKALILASEPATGHAQTIASFRGAAAHDFEWLRVQLHHRGVSITSAVRRQLDIATTWTTNIRYDPAKMKLEEAQGFLKATSEIVAWAKGRI
jgi:HEPN domain-containing protein